MKIPRLKKVRVAQRRQKLIQLIRENPDYNQQELAESLGVNKSTVSRDLRTINEELNMQTAEDFMIHRQRILSELEANKAVCMEKLEKLKNSPHQGARWMEEWSKIQEKIIRMYGLYAPDKMMIKHSQEFSKKQKDAAVDAAIGALPENEETIDITPLQQLPEKTEDANADYDKSTFSIS